MVMPSLPAELWRLIASDPCLFKWDLAHLSASSFHLLHVIRPFLYHTVHIKAVNREFRLAETLVLLANNNSLAECVVELELSRQVTSPQYFIIEDLPCLINVGALANMTSLKRIKISGNVFRNEVEQNEFARSLAGIPLEQLTCLSCSRFPGDQLEGIGNLKKIFWINSNGCAFSLHSG
jgi:hypothetical protein